MATVKNREELERLTPEFLSVEKSSIEADDNQVQTDEVKKVELKSFRDWLLENEALNEVGFSQNELEHARWTVGREAELPGTGQRVLKHLLAKEIGIGDVERIAEQVKALQYVLELQNETADKARELEQPTELEESTGWFTSLKERIQTRLSERQEPIPLNLFQQHALNKASSHIPYSALPESTIEVEVSKVPHHISHFDQERDSTRQLLSLNLPAADAMIADNMRELEKRIEQLDALDEDQKPGYQAVINEVEEKLGHLSSERKVYETDRIRNLEIYQNFMASGYNHAEAMSQIKYLIVNNFDAAVEAGLIKDAQTQVENNLEYYKQQALEGGYNLEAQIEHYQELLEGKLELEDLKRYSLALNSLKKAAVVVNDSIDNSIGEIEHQEQK